jgi:uncharacterized protein YydD (DUF2326 family)
MIRAAVSFRSIQSNYGECPVHLQFTLKCRHLEVENLDKRREDVKELLSQRQKLSDIMLPLEKLLDLGIAIAEVRLI